MSHNLYLIAHKAHGAATFDVAEQLACPECSGSGTKEYTCVNFLGERVDTETEGCDECDGLGYWWIGATSGWRMYPWWWALVSELMLDQSFGDEIAMGSVVDQAGPMPPHSRNLHNPLARSAEPTKPSTLLTSLGLVKPVEPIKRRI